MDISIFGIIFILFVFATLALWFVERETRHIERLNESMHEARQIKSNEKVETKAKLRDKDDTTH
jgi:hypothetical protein